MIFLSSNKRTIFFSSLILIFLFQFLLNPISSHQKNLLHIRQEHDFSLDIEPPEIVYQNTSGDTHNIFVEGL